MIDRVIESSGTERGLTTAEKRVVRHVVRGLSNKQVARELGVSEATVRAQLLSAFRKLGVSSRGELAHFLFSRVEQAYAALDAERARAVEALEEERELLAALIRQTPIGVLVAAAPSGRVILTNHELTVLLGGAPPLVRSRREYDRLGAVHEDGEPYSADEYPLARALDGERIDTFVTYRRHDGTVTRMRVLAAPVHGRDGAMIAAIRVAVPVSG